MEITQMFSKIFIELNFRVLWADQKYKRIKLTHLNGKKLSKIYQFEQCGKFMIIMVAFNVCQVCGHHICHETRPAHAQYINACAVHQRRCVFQLNDVTSLHLSRIDS